MPASTVSTIYTVAILYAEFMQQYIHTLS